MTFLNDFCSIIRNRENILNSIILYKLYFIGITIEYIKIHFPRAAIFIIAVV
jgi:hypothetical protein